MSGILTPLWRNMVSPSACKDIVLLPRTTKLAKVDRKMDDSKYRVFLEENLLEDTKDKRLWSGIHFLADKDLPYQARATRGRLDHSILFYLSITYTTCSWFCESYISFFFHFSSLSSKIPIKYMTSCRCKVTKREQHRSGVNTFASHCMNLQFFFVSKIKQKLKGNTDFF